MGDSLDQEGRAVAVDPRGNVIIAGVFAGTLDLGEPRGHDLASSGAGDVFVIKLSPQGDVAWSKNLSGAQTQDARGLVALGDGDHAGGAVVVGDFNGTMTLGDLGAVSSVDALDAFAVELNASGSVVWARSFGGAGDDSARGAATDRDGNLYVTGYYHESLRSGASGDLPGKGGEDAFLAKLDRNGHTLWSRALRGASDERGASVAVQDGSDVVVLGSFEGSIDAFGEPLVSAGSTDLFVAKLNEYGSPGWARRLGGPGEEAPGGLAINAEGDALFAASFEGSADFGGGVVESAGAADVLVGALASSTGELRWARRFGDFAAQVPRSLVGLPLGGALVAGDFAGGLHFGSGWIGSSGGLDIFLAELAH